MEYTPGSSQRGKGPSLDGISVRGIVALAVVGIVILAGFKCIKTIEAGHVGVVTLFGKVRDQPYEAGLHLVNPLYRWTIYDARKKTHMERAMVPSQDQLQTTVDVSIQYKLINTMAPKILEETGTADAAIQVHLVPKLRSVIREQGKSIPRAEDFFLEETQQRLQTSILTELVSYLQPKGIEVEAVLIRDITLPEFITRAIEAKKEREQAVERQKAELERFRTEQQQTIAEAEASRRAAEEQATQVRTLADARAYEIEKLNKAIGSNPLYLQLQAMEALKEMSKDPAAKIYFINGDSPNPLPLMHLGQGK
ncbi:Prohibitin family protein [Sulfidibacter corallicola]|uniref:Prohibitin family protein n=1 Tax=Sulfidibacter corallicola TaxID=2818388 RepID=A0A8A4TR99_SULCO|nr:prohibitin family protein [Sulfidibacter corallicola]QTD51538.1 prohibitin family protein [Sulfidibacter corallicola]